MTYVLYHGNCYDGFGAAFAAWLKFGDRARYIPVLYGKPLPDLPDAEVVYIVDFSYSKDVLLALALKAKVIVLDHHKTAEADLAEIVGLENPQVIFDMHRSGALMTYEHLFPGQPVPLLFQYLSDRDLWTFKLDQSARVHKAVASFPMDFATWANEFLDLDRLKREGAVCERLHDQLVQNVCDRAYDWEIAGHRVPVVNTSIAWSEIGNELLRRNPNAPFAACFTVHRDHVQWSLRSEDHREDVSEIAKRFGGGGHRNAAGFRGMDGMPLLKRPVA